MKILSIALKDIVITLKDKKSMALILLMPITLIFVLGMALANDFSEYETRIKSFEIAVVDEDGGEYAEKFKDFLKEDSIEKIIKYREMNYEEALAIVKKGKLPAFIFISENYSQAVKEGKDTKIDIYIDPGNQMKGKIVESIIKSYTSIASAVMNIEKTGDTVLKDYNLEGKMIMPEVINYMENLKYSQIQESNLGGDKSVSSIQYYSAAMVVMYILFVGMLGTSSIIEEKEQKTLERLMGTTAKKSTIVTGKFLGIFLLGVLDVLILIVLTRFLFNVEWGKSLLALILLSLAMIFSASGLSIFIATICKTSKTVDALSPAVIMVISFLGGSMYPIYDMPKLLQDVAKLTPNNWALRGYLSLMLNNGINTIILPVIVLSTVGAIFLIAGISRLKLD
jgi:ABC-2 type transport system permease protein